MSTSHIDIHIDILLAMYPSGDTKPNRLLALEAWCIYAVTSCELKRTSASIEWHAWVQLRRPRKNTALHREESLW